MPHSGKKYLADIYLVLIAYYEYQIQFVRKFRPMPNDDSLTNVNVATFRANTVRIDYCGLFAEYVAECILFDVFRHMSEFFKECLSFDVFNDFYNQTSVLIL